MKHLLLLAAAIGVLPSASAQEPGPETVDTSFAVPVKRPILCTRKLLIEGSMTVKSGKSEQAVPVKIEDEVQFIDEYSILTKDREEGTRYFVKAASKAHGEITDPPFAGIEVSYTRDSLHLRSRITNGRTLPQKAIQDLLRAADALGIWLELPEKAKVGASYEIDLAPLGSVLLSGELPVTAAASTLKLESFDRAAGLATFKGEAMLTEEGPIEDNEAKADYTGTCTLRVKPAEQRIISISMKGKYRLEWKGSFQAKGEGTFGIELATEIGEAPGKLRKSTPQFRDRVSNIPQYGVKVKLPSHYARMPAEKDKQQYLRTLESDENIAIILFQVLAGDTSKPQAFYDSIAAEIRKNDKSARFERVKSPIGAGFACLTIDRSQPESPQRVRAEVYPYRSVFLLYKLVASPKSYAAAEREFIKARASLSEMK